MAKIILKNNGKRLISAILSVVMLLGVISAIPMTASANSPGTTTFEYDGYTVDYIINNINTWNNSQGIQVIVTNTGDEPIENWMLAYDDFCGEIQGIWNADVELNNSGLILDGIVAEYGDAPSLDDLFSSFKSEYASSLEYIRNKGYNGIIYPNASVNFGYTLLNATGIPNSFDMVQKRSNKTDGFNVDLNIIGSPWSDDGEDFFNGEIVLTNTSDKAIESWELTFDSNFTITQITTSWNGFL